VDDLVPSACSYEPSPGRFHLECFHLDRRA
jgi:hypothetical protein